MYKIFEIGLRFLYYYYSRMSHSIIDLMSMSSVFLYFVPLIKMVYVVVHFFVDRFIGNLDRFTEQII